MSCFNNETAYTLLAQPEIHLRSGNRIGHNILPIYDGRCARDNAPNRRRSQVGGVLQVKASRVGGPRNDRVGAGKLNRQCGCAQAEDRRVIPAIGGDRMRQRATITPRVPLI